MSSAVTGKTRPLPPGGALMLGAEQDCYGGCVDRGQGYYGLMDGMCMCACGAHWGTGGERGRGCDQLQRWLARG